MASLAIGKAARLLRGGKGNPGLWPLTCQSSRIPCLKVGCVRVSHWMKLPEDRSTSIVPGRVEDRCSGCNEPSVSLKLTGTKPRRYSLLNECLLRRHSVTSVLQSSQNCFHRSSSTVFEKTTATSTVGLCHLGLQVRMYSESVTRMSAPQTDRETQSEPQDRTLQDFPDIDLERDGMLERDAVPRSSIQKGLHTKPSSNSSNPPTRSQLWKHFLNAMIPMIGFGLMDNLIMLQAGELIDTSIGVAFGLSTLTAAAVGQIFSDVSGVCFGGVVGAIAGRFGLPSAMLTPSQQRMGRVRAVGTAGRMVGVVIGCLMGMISLCFMDLEESQRLRRFKELQPILVTITRHTKRALGVNSCRIYFLGVDQEGQEALFEVGLPQSTMLAEEVTKATNKSRETSGGVSGGVFEGVSGGVSGGVITNNVSTLASNMSTLREESQNPSLYSMSPSIRGFSNHYTHKESRPWTFLGLRRHRVSTRKDTEVDAMPSMRPKQIHGAGHVALAGEASQQGWIVSTEKCRTDPLLKCVKIGPSHRLVSGNGGASFDQATDPLATDDNNSHSNQTGSLAPWRADNDTPSSTEDHVQALDGPSSDSESIVSFVARTGHAVMCIRHSDDAQEGSTRKPVASLHAADIVQVATPQSLWREGTNCVTLASTSPVSHALLCYPVFDDMDRDRVIGVIELADKQPPPGSPSGTVAMFTRDDERLVRMLSEHLSLYLALGSYYKHEGASAEALESIEKIGWVCPEPKRTI